MTPEANAILGLFFALWSHEVIHRYDERGHRAQLAIAAVAGVLSLYFLLLALARSLGWVQ